jgi:hypothetical protein
MDIRLLVMGLRRYSRGLEGMSSRSIRGSGVESAVGRSTVKGFDIRIEF